MMDIYRSLTEDDGEAGVLKSLSDESDLESLRQNPFHITKSNIKVSSWKLDFLAQPSRQWSYCLLRRFLEHLPHGLWLLKKWYAVQWND